MGAVRRSALAAVAVAVALALAAPAWAQTAGSQGPRETVTATTMRGAESLVEPPSYDRPLPGRRLSARQVLRIAGGAGAVRRARDAHAGSYARAYLRTAGRWQASFYVRRARERPEEIAQVLIADRDGRVLETWTGVQVAWTMARGYPGAFGRSLNAPWLWLPLCLAFLAPFARCPLRLLHLDLLVLLAFSVSYAFFSAAELGVSVPLSYPPLGYLLVRMLALAIARGRALGSGAPVLRAPLRPAVPAAFLALAVVFLIGFRVALNVTDGNVIDVGYAGVIGADKLTSGRPLYGAFPLENEHGDTYGPVAYAAYVPFEQALPWGGRWDGLPAAHAAAIAFDLGCVLLLWLLGRRIRGPGLGLLLAYLWVTYPFTLLVSDSASNDSLVALLVLLALLVAGRPVARGAAVALAGLTKFAPLALAPLFATYSERSRARSALMTGLGFGAVALLALGPLAAGGELAGFWDRTLGFQRDRGSPFSVWGYYGGLEGAQTVAQAAAGALAVAVAFLPRRRDLISVAALAAAVLIALQLVITHWFYLYVVWFVPLVLIALLAPHQEPEAA